MTLLASQPSKVAVKLEELKAQRSVSAQVNKPNKKVMLPKLPFDNSTRLGLPSTTAWTLYKDKKLKSWASLVQPGYDEYLDTNLKGRRVSSDLAEDGEVQGKALPEGEQVLGESGDRAIRQRKTRPSFRGNRC